MRDHTEGLLSFTACPKPGRFSSSGLGRDFLIFGVRGLDGIHLTTNRLRLGGSIRYAERILVSKAVIYLDLGDEVVVDVLLAWPKRTKRPRGAEKIPGAAG